MISPLQKQQTSFLSTVPHARSRLFSAKTGLSEEHLQKSRRDIQKSSSAEIRKHVSGINTLLKLVQDAAKVLATAGFDMEIVEKHHRLKVEPPSGTALALADSINEAMDNKYHYV